MEAVDIFIVGAEVIGLALAARLSRPVIREEGDSGLPGLVNLVGIESPGLAS